MQRPSAVQTIAKQRLWILLGSIILCAALACDSSSTDKETHSSKEAAPSGVVQTRVQKHWSEMPAISEPAHRELKGAMFPTNTSPRQGRVICRTELHVNSSGAPTHAETKVNGDCTEYFARIADEEAMKARWTSRPQAVGTNVPVFIDHEPDRCETCVKVTVAPE